MKILLFLPLIYCFPFSFNKPHIPLEHEYLNYLEEYDKLNKNKEEVSVFPPFFSQFKQQKPYEEDKFNVFKQNYNHIQNINSELSNNNCSFQLGTNSLFDEYSYNNVSHINLNTIISNNFTIEKRFRKYRKNPFRYIKKLIKLKGKKEFHWRDTTLLSPVKNQGKCGSCWAFSATNALETFMRSEGYPVDRLSEQELVDCSKENNGCNGGFMHTAFDYIIKEKGLSSEEKYPYLAKTMDCRHSNCAVDDQENFIPKLKGSSLINYEFTVPKSIIDRLLSIQISPICIALDASSIYFRFYKSGVIDIDLKEQKLNHAVLLVGYGYDEEGLYWIIQNSWGEKWGENGFCKIRVKEGDGILLSNLYGVYPTKVN